MGQSSTAATPSIPKHRDETRVSPLVMLPTRRCSLSQRLSFPLPVVCLLSFPTIHPLFPSFLPLLSLFCLSRSLFTLPLPHYFPLLAFLQSLPSLLPQLPLSPSVCSLSLLFTLILLFLHTFPPLLYSPVFPTLSYPPSIFFVFCDLWLTRRRGQEWIERERERRGKKGEEEEYCRKKHEWEKGMGKS